MLRKFMGRFMLLAVTALALAFVVGCGGGDSNGDDGDGSTAATQTSGGGDKPQVALVLKTLANPVWQATQVGAEAKARELGLDLSVQAGKTEADVQGQINIVEDLMAKGVDAIAITANGTGQLRPVLERAQAEGVRVVLIDTDVPDLERVTLIQTDNRGMSKQISEQFVEELGGRGQAGVLTFPNVSPVELRVQGTEDAVSGTGVELVAKLAGNCLRNTAVNATSDMLQAHPDITAIFGECGQNATGAVQGVSAAGKVPGKDVRIIGFDGVPQELQLIEEGKMYATVWQDFPAIGAQAIQDAVDAVGGKTFDPVTYVPGEVITKDNADQFEVQGDIVVRKG